MELPQSATRADFAGRRVLITGHTGFKGAWLTEWLIQSGAEVSGISLPPESPEALSVALRIPERVNHAIVDIRDSSATAAAIHRADPEFIFHLAAQALVRRSYAEPLLTWQTNVSGTLSVLEGAKALGRRVVVVVVTTDKVYKNREWEFGYREVDELGGHDPYSASKAACELAVSSWRACFATVDGPVVATARAGNVLGGGDVSEDRIVPDCFRAWREGRNLEMRQPHSTRPWQHVLEPLSGYLSLAMHLEQSRHAVESCNFGPSLDGHRSVKNLVESFALLAPRRGWSIAKDPGMHEARTLALCIDRARDVLRWSPVLSFSEMVRWTNAGYVSSADKLHELVSRQIEEYEQLRVGRRLPAEVCT